MHPFQFKYNAVNQVSRKTDNGGRSGIPPNYQYDSAKSEVYFYNPNGTLQSKIDRNGKQTDYTYDIHGQKKTVSTDDTYTEYTYDQVGNLTVVSNNAETITRTYNEVGSVTQKTVSGIGSTTYVYGIVSGLTAGHVAEKTTDPKGNIKQKNMTRLAV